MLEYAGEVAIARVAEGGGDFGERHAAVCHHAFCHLHAALVCVVDNGLAKLALEDMRDIVAGQVYVVGDPPESYLCGEISVYILQYRDDIFVVTVEFERIEKLKEQAVEYIHQLFLRVIERGYVLLRKHRA